MKAKAIHVLLALATSLVAFAAESSDAGIRQLGKGEADKAALQVFEGNTPTMYIWSDRLVYQPGEQLTLRWTVNTNNDLYPYTIVAYRQNNQTGVKTYVGANRAGTEAIDIFGNTLAQGFVPTRLSNASRAVLIGAGGAVLNAPATIPNELGMHTLTVELRDVTGTRVLKAAYMKIGVVSEFVDLNATVINTNTTWTNTRAYRIRNIVRVQGATLTIEPGTIVLGQERQDDPSTLVITPTGRINAQGTRSRPIIMTSGQPIGQRTSGFWGGLIMLGRARINAPGGTAFVEGLSSRDFLQYGGTDDTHNCGTLAYVRVEYAGSIFAQNQEINSFTWAGCGSQTVAHHLQAIYGLDDSFEWFGGNNNAKYLVGGLGADDYIDWQTGWTGKVQYGVFYQDDAAGRGNRGIEGDNSNTVNAEPVSNPTVFNTTYIGSGVAGRDEANSPGIAIRVGTRGSVNNSIVTRFRSTGFNVIDTAGTAAETDTLDQIRNNRFTANGMLLWNNGNPVTNTLDGQIGGSNATATTLLRAFAAGTTGTGRNFIVADPMLRRPFDYSDPDFRPMTGSPALRTGWVAPPDDGFFDQNASFLGGMGEENWMEEWTNFLRDEDIRP